MTEQTYVEIDHEDLVTTLTMVYRPYNLIGPKILGAIHNGLDAAQEAGSRAIIIRSGLRHFSAGADLDILQSQSVDREAGESTSEEKPVRDPAKDPVVRFLETLELFPIPIIASVHGVCLGGGFELALATDYIIAGKSTKIGSVEVTLGLHPLMGAIQRQVQRAGVHRAKEMSMLGRRYDAATLERWGLVNLVVDDDKLDIATKTVAQEFAHGPTVAHAATKRLAHIAANQGVRAADEAMADIQKPIWASEDVKSGLDSFMKYGPGSAKFAGR